MKIGITIKHEKPGDSIWSNGIKLNALILAKMLLNSPEGHDVYLINVVDNKESNQWDSQKYKMILLDEAKEILDVIIILGAALHDDYINHFKSLNKDRRVIYYKCGNHYILDTEKVIFKENSENNKPIWTRSIDEVWIIPQQEYHNLHYFYTFFRKPVRVVPFVWDPEHVQKRADEMASTGKFKPVEYKPSDSKKRVSVFEPNINIIKYSMIPIHIVEWANWDPIVNDRLDFLSVTNGDNLLKNHEFNGHIKHLDIYKQKKIYIEARYNTPFFLAEHTDVVLSHQWGNPLNYAYLDALYFNYPLVHNAEMIKDMGYYYNDFNIELGSIQLKNAILEHDQNRLVYNNEHKKLLQRYESSNIEIIKQYDGLLRLAVESVPDFRVRSGYDWKTNTVEL